jgi:hypothetical protein
MSYWKKLLITLGAKRHRCARCRCNFVSFRPRSPIGSSAIPLQTPAPTVD